VRTVSVVAAAVAVTACSSSPSAPSIQVRAPDSARANIEQLASFVPYDSLSVTGESDGASADIVIDVVADLTDCGECYRIDHDAATPNVLVVHGGEALGVQYGVAHALELLGFRFFHPWATHVPPPAAVAVPSASPDYARAFEPERATRGLHLHTIHPIEAYYAFWEPGQQQLDDAARILDWAIKQRANYVQWVGLDNIVTDPNPAVAADWRAHTQQIIAAANARGLRTGLAIQLFGESNLQQGFDLVDDTMADARAQMDARYPIVLDDLPFDTVNLSFGEFFGEDPAAFVASLDLAYDALLDHAPGTEMATTIHVGNSPDQRVDYMGESLIYYFLVKFADPGIIPWVHSVMYYNLFEDAGGAYHHDDFSEHRQYLFDRLAAGERVGYFPETAYWVAFDNSVPIYTPLYVRSRWLDLDRIRAQAAADLDEHVLFSSGWEWGYWQNDYAALRASYTLPDRWEQLFEDMYAPYGDAGAELAAQQIEIARLQHEHLIENRLASFLAGRDVYIDLGDDLDIVSQPDRPVFAEVAAMTAGERADFETSVLDELQAFADASDAAAVAIAAIVGSGGLPSGDPFAAEAVDAAAVTAARIRYIHALYRATVSFADTGSDGGWLDTALGDLDAARAIVERRHAALHHPGADDLTLVGTNATLYQYGYLKQAHDLCYWDRERAKVERLLGDDTATVPSCVF
jgi:hypothetical protein